MAQITMSAARDEVRWFPAMVSNHVMDLIEKYGWDSDIPSELTDFVKGNLVDRHAVYARFGLRNPPVDRAGAFDLLGRQAALRDERSRRLFWTRASAR